jgi:glucokinase
MILAADVGGTKTNLALFTVRGGRMERDDVSSFHSREFPSFESIIEKFLAGRGPVDLVCAGVAGPVRKGRSRLTNLPWIVDEESIRRACGARRGFLINDLQATAFSVLHLPPGLFAVLQAGEADPRGTIAVVAAGTGLGVGFLVRCGRGYLPFASEGGHAGFSPGNGREEKLLAFLKGLYGRASAERAVSGPGLHAIYRFLREVEGIPVAAEIEARILVGDPPRVIAEEGISGRSPLCGEALRFFVSLFGSLAGDFALNFNATGGVVLGGGIAPAILPVLSEGGFLESFASKGRFRDFLSGIPVKVILDDQAALLGAAHFALAMEEEA